MIKSTLQTILNSLPSNTVLITGSRKNQESFKNESDDLDLIIDCESTNEFLDILNLDLPVTIDIYFYNFKVTSNLSILKLKSNSVLLTQELIDNITDESLGYIN